MLPYPRLLRADAKDVELAARRALAQRVVDVGGDGSVPCHQLRRAAGAQKVGVQAPEARDGLQER